MAEKHRIELIPKEVRAVKTRTLLIRSLRLGGFVLLGAVVLVTVGLLAAVQAQTAALEDVQQQVAVEEAKLADLSEVEAKVTGLAAKSAVVGYVFEHRKYYSLLLEALSKSTPDGVTVTGLSVSQGDEIGLTGEVMSYTHLANFLRDLVDPEKGGSLFTEVGLASVTFNPVEGTAQFAANVTMARNGLSGGWESLLGEGWESNVE